MRSASPRVVARSVALLAALGLLGGCGLFRKPLPADDEPTLASLQGRRIAVQADAAVDTDEARTAAAYRAFLAAAPDAPQRPEAMRRLGDLAMDAADRRLADGATPDYAEAIAQYQAFLKAYPDDPARDRALYQLARAQEQGGQLESALKTLTALVAAHPGAPFADEAQFRRGELLFATRDYARAEAAYTQVLQGRGDTPYHERALFMQGWSRFKQGRLDDALQSFFGVLDAKLGHGQALSRPDRELVDDTFRVTGIALSNLGGAASIPPFIVGDERLAYEDQVYERLGELYLKQERVKDAADTFAAFARARPLHARAPALQSRVIEIYADNGFATLALQAKKDFVAHYGAGSAFRRANPEGWQQAQPLVKSRLAELAQHHHALAQQDHRPEDVAEAVHWYRESLAAFPDDAGAPQSRFLLAELLFENRRYAEAAVEYEHVAYDDAAAPRGADAGYGALLAYAAQGDGGDAATRTAVASALRFGERYAGDGRAGAVLTHAAEQLYTLKDGARAAEVARRALALPLDRAQKRTAWTVIAHEAFDRSAWADAETAYGEALKDADAAQRGALTERLAAAVYQQGDAARTAGRPRDAVAAFERVARVAPDSPVRATAQFDAAAALIGVGDWPAATQLLEDFRERWPGHALQSEVGVQLAAAYLAQQQWSRAAGEFERVAAATSDTDAARQALWQAATLHEKAGDPLTTRAYETYLRRYPQPLEPAVVARARLAQAASGDRALAWWKEVVVADATGGEQRSARTRALAAEGTLALAQPVAEAYRKVALVEPLARQLKLKKARLEDALKAYAAAAEYGVAEVSTAATFHTAALYQDFGQAMLGSQRPRKLSKAEREQYDVMLEEQAFPFEEKAIALHEINARRSTEGVFDEWVRASFASLARLKPARWGKAEREDPDDALNQQGIAARRDGRFAQAREAYERALAARPAAVAPLTNLAILFDLYLGEPARALELYERALAAGPDASLSRWVAEVRNRKPVAAAQVVSRKETP